MRRFIITGAPGAGKTAIIRQLEIDGCSRPGGEHIPLQGSANLRLTATQYGNGKLPCLSAAPVCSANPVGGSATECLGHFWKANLDHFSC